MCLDDISLFLSLDLWPVMNCKQPAGQQVEPLESPVQWL